MRLSKTQAGSILVRRFGVLTRAAPHSLNTAGSIVVPILPKRNIQVGLVTIPFRALDRLCGPPAKSAHKIDSLEPFHWRSLSTSDRTVLTTDRIQRTLIRSWLGLNLYSRCSTGPQAVQDLSRDLPTTVRSLWTDRPQERPTAARCSRPEKSVK